MCDTYYQELKQNNIFLQQNYFNEALAKKTLNSQIITKLNWSPVNRSAKREYSSINHYIDFTDKIIKSLWQREIEQ